MCHPFETEDGHLNLDEALSEIKSTYFVYGLENDSNLTKDAQALKQRINSFVNEIKSWPDSNESEPRKEQAELSETDVLVIKACLGTMSAFGNQKSKDDITQTISKFEKMYPGEEE